MKRHTILLALLTILIFVLVSCGSDNVSTAVSYLDALNNGDIAEAATFACDEREDDIVNGLISVDPEERATIEFQRVSCSQRAGDEVLCRFTIVQEDTESNNETVFEEDRSVVFNIEDGQICGFHEEVAN